MQEKKELEGICDNDDCEINAFNSEKVSNIKKDLIGDETIEELSQIFKTLGDPTRLKIIYALSKGQLCVCDIAEVINMSQSATSHQLRILRNMRLVKYKKEGKSAIYSLDDDHVLQLFNQGLEHTDHK